MMKRFLFNMAILPMAIAATVAAGSRILETPSLGNYPNVSPPLSTNTTVTPDAAPTNTTSINVSTSTNFKGKLEGNPMTGVVRGTDAHPAGTYTVTVKAFDSGGASVTKTFTLMVTTPSTCTPVRFAATNFAAGTAPYSIAVGDFNGDGKQDVASVNYSSNNVSILLGDGAGSFSAAANFAVGTNPYSLAVGDFNGDGKEDFAVAHVGSPSGVSILLGDGAGGFSGPSNFSAGGFPLAVTVGDVNGDGKQDLAVANANSDNVSILLGNGTGGFSAPTNFAAGSSPSSVAIGDFNGDGKQDLAVANNTSPGVVSILLGDGTGHFSAAVTFDTGSYPYSVTVGDFNGDGTQDLTVANNNKQGTVSILLGIGGGSFSAPADFATGSFPSSAAVGDFNGDGKHDVAVANQGLFDNGNVSIFLGDGAGNFGAATNFGAGIHPKAIAVGDFNGDGKQDLAITNYNSGNVSILSRVCSLTVTNAASRKTHGSTGTFDINLPLTGSPGIECRATGGTNDYTMVVAFSDNITVTGNPQGQVTMGTGCVGSAGTCNVNSSTFMINGNVVIVRLTNVANVQSINVTLNNVSGGIGNVVIPMGVLAGDVNGNRVVNAGDVALAKSRIGQSVGATNFRTDVNANGVLNGTDVSIVKSRVGTGLP